LHDKSPLGKIVGAKYANDIGKESTPLTGRNFPAGLSKNLIPAPMLWWSPLNDRWNRMTQAPVLRKPAKHKASAIPADSGTTLFLSTGNGAQEKPFQGRQ